MRLRQLLTVGVVVTACLAGTSPAAPILFNIIGDVPGYSWYHGCGPTAAGMILGYWDNHGFGNLIPGSNDWNSNTQAIKDAIASPGHIADYALYDGVDDYSTSIYPDISSIDPNSAHADDSIADFMLTSRSAEGLRHGWSFTTTQLSAMVKYAQYRGYDQTTISQTIYPDLWEDFVEAVDNGIPVEFYVDMDSDGSGDHFVVATGYSEVNGVRSYVAYNTWDTDLHWYDFTYGGDGLGYGVFTGMFFQPVPEPAVIAPAIMLLALLRRRRTNNR